MKYFSMFSGIGTGEQGIEQAFGGKAECIGFSEIDRHAAAIYKFHRPDHRNYGDATKLIPSELPDFDFLIGGFPCQAFSIAGKRLGFEDTRGTLFFEIARVLREKRPSHFLLENVAGLLSHDNGSTFRTIVSALDEIGYDLEWTVINSKDHGVPQNRERVFIIGHPRNGSCGQVFSFGESGGTAIGLQEQQANCLTARYEGAAATGTYIVERELYAQGVNHPSRGVEVRTDGLAATLKSGESGTQRPKVALVANQTTIRRLTTIECERLQGCPDNFTKFGRYGDEVKEVADTNRYKGLGNAFTVNVIEAIITRMIETECLK